MSIKPFDEPIKAAAEHGEVVLDGPNGLAASLTPQAALQSSERIAEAARLAARQADIERT